INHKDAIFTNIRTRNVRELIVLLSLSDMYIGNDNGPRHFAQAVDTPSFAIFTTMDNKKSFCPHNNLRHRAVDMQNVLKINDEEYLKYIKEQQEFVKDIPYNFVEEFVINMIEEIGILKK
ncbi:MAG: hypothetical protein KBE03_08530, partial [Leptotrichiaceae bacterium]|nr:hypothetical protein [Leptotrichiaceae bacterium]